MASTRRGRFEPQQFSLMGFSTIAAGELPGPDASFDADSVRFLCLRPCTVGLHTVGLARTIFSGLLLGAVLNSSRGKSHTDEGTNATIDAPEAAALAVVMAEASVENNPSHLMWGGGGGGE